LLLAGGGRLKANSLDYLGDNMSNTQCRDFDWSGELHKTVVHSLTTTFGLDFLLLEDKAGGDVDTVHNVRNGVWATKKAERAYQSRGQYDSHAYHSHENYIAKGREDKAAQKNGELYDAYRNKTMGQREDRHLDHTVSAHEIHNDAGRVLAEANGVELANQSSNLNSTGAYVNIKKSNQTTEQFLNNHSAYKEQKIASIQLNQDKLKSMPENTPQQRHEKQKLQDKIRKDQEHLEELNAVNPEKMQAADDTARKAYNAEVNYAYYTSSKFFKNTTAAAANQGIRMGARQALGLVLAEIWFELKAQLPKMYHECKQKFSLEKFFQRIQKTLQNIWTRVTTRFKDLLTSFKDGFLGGILASINSTILNIFVTTNKLVGKLIRESWQSLVKAVKLIFFNPERLALGDLAREVSRLLGAGLSVTLGVILNQQLAILFKFPFGQELAAFVSAMATGLMTIGMTYFLDHSPLMQKVWNFLNQFKSKYRQALEEFQKINTELDRYLVELSKLEFNMDPVELKEFTDSLLQANDEYQRSMVLATEINRRNISLPFETGNVGETRNWLKKL